MNGYGGLRKPHEEGDKLDDVILKIDHVSKFYPGVAALNDVSMEIKKGEVRALVGENRCRQVHAHQVYYGR